MKTLLPKILSLKRLSLMGSGDKAHFQEDSARTRKFVHVNACCLGSNKHDYSLKLTSWCQPWS